MYNNYAVIRRVKLQQPLPPQEALAALTKSGVIDALTLIDDQLSLSYDTRKQQWSSLEAQLLIAGCQFKQSWRQAVKRRWYRYLDQNMAANARHRSHCCNRPPR